MNEQYPDCIVQAVSPFEKIELEALPAEILMKRFDRKFLCHKDDIAAFLKLITQDYQNITAAGQSISPYSSQYLDTADLSFFKAHHARRATRSKIRIRKYSNTGTAFMEVKMKNNKGFTRKERTRVGYNDSLLSSTSRTFLANYFPEEVLKSLGATVAIHYHRIALIDTVLNERVSIDFRISTEQDGRSAHFGDVAIIEVKTDAIRRSPAVAALRSLSIREFSFSKYCLSMTLLHKNLKSNAFKPNLHYLQKIDHAFTF